MSTNRRKCTGRGAAVQFVVQERRPITQVARGLDINEPDEGTVLGHFPNIVAFMTFSIFRSRVYPARD